MDSASYFKLFDDDGVISCGGGDDDGGGGGDGDHGGGGGGGGGGSGGGGGGGRSWLRAVDCISLKSDVVFRTVFAIIAQLESLSLCLKLLFVGEIVVQTCGSPLPHRSG